MARFITLAVVMATVLFVNATTFSYRFSSTPLTQAIQKIISDHPDIDLSFIYNELENYRTSATVRSDNPYDALRQAIGFNPVSVVKSGGRYYVEALQRGKYVFTGHVSGPGPEPVANATVMFLAPGDSTLLTYGYTDAGGGFVIPCDYRSVIAKVTCLGYTTVYRRCNTREVGTITMQPRAIRLGEVRVESEGVMVGHDKIMLNINRNLRRHSHDGYTLLNVAMIPGLEVNPFDHTVQSQGENVLLCINGIPASKGEIRTLNPKDVARIDFYTGYDPRNPSSRFTLDFIVNIREQGGAVTTEAMQHLNKPTGSGMIDWRMYRGKTEFGVRIEGNYDSYAQGLREENQLEMEFERGDVALSMRSITDRNRNQSVKVKPYLIHRGQNSTLKLTFALQQQHARKNDTQIQEYSLLSGQMMTAAAESDHSDRFLPSISGMYQHKYSSTRYLSVFVNGNYSRTNNTRDYIWQEDVLSRTHENFYGGNATIQYSFGFSDTQKGFITAGGGVNYSRISYDENMSSSQSRLTTRYIRMAIGDNWRLNRSLSLYMMLGGEVTDIDNFSSRSTQFTLIPTMRASWSIANGNTLNGNFSISSRRPPMSYYSPDEKWVMPVLRLVGNPNLKMSRVINTSINYRNVRNWGYMGVFATYSGVSRSVYHDFMCDNTREVYIQTFRNGRTFHDISVGPTLQLKAIPRHLTLRLNGKWEYIRTVTYRSLHHHTLAAYADIMFMAGGFSANLKCSTPTRILSNLGIMGYVPWNLQLSANYDINNWTMGITVRNPFMTETTWSRAVLPGIHESSEFYSPRTRYNMVALTIGYRFGYGKPKKKYEDVQLEENENTAILGL